MKRMKHNMIGRIALLAVLLFLSTSNVYAANDTQTQVQDLAPNIFQDEQIKLNPDSLGQTKREVENIPEEIRGIPFTDEEKKPSLKSSLFLNDSTTNHSIQSQVNKYGLFTSTESPVQSSSVQDVPEETGLKLQWVYILLIGIGLVLLFTVLIPKLKPAQINGQDE
ncbi:type VII secretion protein EssA [Priestia flexa]|uniref:Type VII secretion protein EssA n=2 Tax=Priestia flexa TaxID=86664 RepID=A0ABU4J1R0_9BACI|nr:type VII secretion protein EssA [Priestia flexa]MCA1202930.1 type VII secretion protein EssA [Priestia flexa]MCP1187878.1 type VII secretion protein EssA [Priestia flexa]MDW8514800.1 type VII secretion protein EssA [Priestia flexa]MEC0664855.1 type VII secretion protein EssA [Priestia flexa]QCS54521.1 type VII secretion protein EssA [Priestia flexa]